MRVVLLLGTVLFISWCGVGLCHSGRHQPHHKHHHDDDDDDDDQVLGGSAAPTDGGNSPVPIDAGAAPVALPVPASGDAPPVAPDSTPAVILPASGYRKETTDTLSKQSSEANSQSNTKENVKVITKHRKDGSTVTIIKDKSKTKTQKDLLTDDYNQTNHTLTEGGVEDSTSLTTDKQHEVKETDVIKKKDTERIVTDKYGNVISDTHKTKEKEKVKKKEKDTETSSLVHTVKSVPPPVAVDPADAPAPAPDAPADGC